MKQRIYKWSWGFPLDLDQREQSRIEYALVRANHRTFCLMAGVILFFQLVMMAITLFKDGGPFISFRRSMYWWMYVLLFILTAVFLLLGQHIYRKKPLNGGFYLKLQACYAAIFCYWSCVITLLDQLGGTSLSVYSYGCIALAAMTLLKPWQGVAIFGSSFLALNFCLFWQEQGRDNLFFNLTNTLFVCLLSIVISVVFYRNKIFSLHNKEVIESQYRQIEQMNRRLEILSITDELTQMHNRRYLQQLPDQDFFSAGRRVAGMMLDIDAFKQYNDRYGHIAGDDCLKQLARIIDECIAGKEIYAVRYGGEEFFLCMIDPTAGEVDALAQRLRALIAAKAPRRDDMSSGHVTVSIGVHSLSIGQDGGACLKELIRCADEALYQAKKSGKDRICYYARDEVLPV